LFVNRIVERDGHALRVLRPEMLKEIAEAASILESLSRWPHAQVLRFNLSWSSFRGLVVWYPFVVPVSAAPRWPHWPVGRREATALPPVLLGTACGADTAVDAGGYTLVFRHVFQVRWSPPGEGNLAFALRLYAGLAVFNFFAECVNRAPLLIVEQPHLVKKVVFPVEVLPWASVMAALAHLGIAAVALLGLRWLGMGTVPLSALALPLVWLPLLPLCLGLGWGLSAVGTFIRDIGQILSMAMTALVFMSPMFSVDALPAGLRDGWLNYSADHGQTHGAIEGQWPGGACSLSFVASWRWRAGAALPSAPARVFRCCLNRPWWPRLASAGLCDRARGLSKVLRFVCHPSDR
jgi:lipopolysaccharide transport system permease protein